MKNILFIVIDCARTEKTLINFPYATPETGRSARLPFLDRSRSRGTTWTKLCAVSSTTTPNIASIFTGLLPCAHGIIEHSRHSLTNNAATLAELMKNNGYHTYAETTGPLIKESGLDRGFDHYRCRERTEYLHNGFHEYLNGFLPSMKAPWFLFLHLWEAHAPCQNPPPFDDPEKGKTPYDRALSLVDSKLDALFDDIDPRETALVYMGDHGERLTEDYLLNRYLEGDEWKVVEEHRRFNEKRAAGSGCGTWFEHISDALGEVQARIYAHNVVGHGFHLTEELIRVPLVIADPGRCNPGSRVDSLRSQVDMFHTLMDLAGVDGEGVNNAKGSSLLDLSGRNRIYIEANGSGGRKHTSRCYLRGARTARWKYWRVEGANEDRAVLWDLKNDPRETRDCSIEHPDKARELDRFVDSCMEQHAPAADQDRDEQSAQAIEAKMRELGYI